MTGVSITFNDAATPGLQDLGAAGQAFAGPVAGASSNVFYASYVERGTSRMAPRWMFREGLRATQPQVPGVVIAAMRRTSGRAAAVTSAKRAIQKLLVTRFRMAAISVAPSRAIRRTPHGRSGLVGRRRPM